MSTLSKDSRRAQSRLANATKAGASPNDLSHLRTAFKVARAVDALRAIPAPLSAAERTVLHNAVDTLPHLDSGEQS